MIASRPIRFLFALFGYSSVHWAAGRWVRALVWDALFFGYVALIFRLPIWILFALDVAQAIDAALLDPGEDRTGGRYLVAGVLALSALGLSAVAMKACWVGAFRIPAGSMIPALQVGDHMFADKTKHPRRGDPTVFIYPREPSKDYIKRVVAVGGDTVEVRDNQLFVNDKPVPRVHVDQTCEYDDYFADDRRWDRRACDAWDETLDGRTYRVVFDRDGGLHSAPRVTVPADSYYVLGDNRDNSHDSRYWGFVPQKLIKGIARKIWWSDGPEGVRWRRIDQAVR